MATCAVTNASIFTGANPDQAKMDTNDNDIVSFINTNCVVKAGTPAFTSIEAGPTTTFYSWFSVGPADRLFPNLAANKFLVDYLAQSSYFEQLKQGFSPSPYSNDIPYTDWQPWGPEWYVYIPEGATSCLVKMINTTRDQGGTATYQVRGIFNGVPVTFWGDNHPTYVMGAGGIHQFNSWVIWDCTSVAGTGIGMTQEVKLLSGSGAYSSVGSLGDVNGYNLRFYGG